MRSTDDRVPAAARRRHMRPGQRALAIILLLAGGFSAAACGPAGTAPAPPGTVPDAPATVLAGAPGTTRVNAVYRVEIRGQAGVLSGYAPFTVLADLYVVPTFDVTETTRNLPNPVEIGIWTSTPPGTPGALSFGTNTALAGAQGVPAGSAVDIAFVTVNESAGRIDVTVDADVFASAAARSPAFNVYGVNGGSQLHHVLAGTLSIQFSPGGAAVNGTIQLAGNPEFGSPGLVSQYAATFAGTLASGTP